MCPDQVIGRFLIALNNHFPEYSLRVLLDIEGHVNDVFWNVLHLCVLNRDVVIAALTIQVLQLLLRLLDRLELKRPFGGYRKTADKIGIAEFLITVEADLTKAIKRTFTPARTTCQTRARAKACLVW